MKRSAGDRFHSPVDAWKGTRAADAPSTGSKTTVARARLRPRRECWSPEKPPSWFLERPSAFREYPESLSAFQSENYVYMSRTIKVLLVLVAVVVLWKVFLTPSEVDVEYDPVE